MEVATISGSELNIPDIGAANIIVGTIITIEHAVDMKYAILAPVFARSTLPTPRFCPTNVVVASASDCMGRNMNWSTFEYVVHPPVFTVIFPSVPAIYDCTKTFANAVSAICIADGIPIFTILLSIAVSTRSHLRRRRTHESVLKSTMSVSTAERHCEMTVASATPATPILKQKTNTTSSTVFVTAQTIRK